MQQLRIVDKQNKGRRSYRYLRCIVNLQPLSLVGWRRCHQLRIHNDLIQYIGLNSQNGIIMNLINDWQNRVDPLLFQCGNKQDRCIG